MIDPEPRSRPKLPVATCTRLFENCLMAELSDEIDLAVRDELRAALLPLIDSQVAIVDITEVSFSDTTLLNAVLRLVKQRRQAGNNLPLRIAGAGSHVRRIFALTHVDRFVCFYDSMRNTRLKNGQDAPDGSTGEGAPAMFSRARRLLAARTMRMSMSDPRRRARAILRLLGVPAHSAFAPSPR